MSPGTQIGHVEFSDNIACAQILQGLDGAADHDLNRGLGDGGRQVGINIDSDNGRLDGGGVGEWFHDDNDRRRRLVTKQPDADRAVERDIAFDIAACAVYIEGDRTNGAHSLDVLGLPLDFHRGGDHR